MVSLYTFGCGFGYSPAFGDEAPFRTHMFLRRELDLLLELRLHIGGTLKPLILGRGKLVR